MFYNVKASKKLSDKCHKNGRQTSHRNEAFSWQSK